MPSFDAVKDQLASGVLLATGLLFVAALITSTVADPSSRVRRIALGLSGGLLAVADILPRHLGDDWIAVGAQFAAVAVLVGALFLRNARIRSGLAGAAALVILCVEGREVWREGGWAAALWPLVAAAAAAG